MEPTIRQLPAVRCPHCANGGWRPLLNAVTTERGAVMRCWNCGGEFVNDFRAPGCPLTRLYPLVCAVHGDGRCG